MFKITPIQSFEEQMRYADACGRDAKEGLFGYGMSDYDTGALMGFSQFEIDDECGVIHDLTAVTGYDDFEAMFILGRQTLNFIDKCGIHKCRADASTAERRLLISIGFKEISDGEYICDLNGMFDGHCDGKKVEL